MSDANVNHQPCPYNDCGSSDGFSWESKYQCGKCFVCGESYPMKGKMDKVFDWAKEAYPLKDRKEKPVLSVVEDILEQPVDAGIWKHVGCRKITSKTMEFYAVKT